MENRLRKIRCPNAKNCNDNDCYHKHEHFETLSCRVKKELCKYHSRCNIQLRKVGRT